MKSILRTLVLLLLTVAVLGVMHHYGLLNVGAVVTALVEKPQYVVLIMATQLLLQFLMLFRYRALAHMLEIHAPLKQMAAAAYVSTAIGQWMPGSLAVCEVIRVGLMIGADKHAGRQHGTDSDSRLRARLAVASVIDRLVGFCTMMFAGALCCAYALPLFTDAQTRWMVATLGFILFGGASLICALPILARLPWWQRCLQNWEERLSGRKILQKGVIALRVLLQTLLWSKEQRRKLILPMVLGFLTHITACFAVYESALALGTPISFIAILAVFPVTAICSILPIGFGGLGGYQLVAIAIFQAFAVPAAVAASATLLQNGLLLLTNSLLGAVFAQQSATQIRAILDSRKRVG